MLKIVNFQLPKHFGLQPEYINEMPFYEYQYLLKDIDEWQKEEKRRNEKEEAKHKAEQRRTENKYKVKHK